MICDPSYSLIFFNTASINVPVPQQGSITFKAFPFTNSTGKTEGRILFTNFAAYSARHIGVYQAPKSFLVWPSYVARNDSYSS